MNITPNRNRRVSTPSPPPSLSTPDSPTPTQEDRNLHSDLKIIHHNSHLRRDVTERIITQTQYDIIALQEPYINPHTLRPPPHPAWNLFLSFDHHPKDYQDRHLTCIYVSKRFPARNISLLNSGSNILTAIELLSEEPNTPNLRIISCYNPPADHRGLPTLRDWLQSRNHRQTPSLIMIDSNLHNPIWSAPHTRRHS